MRRSVREVFRRSKILMARMHIGYFFRRFRSSTNHWLTLFNVLFIWPAIFSFSDLEGYGFLSKCSIKTRRSARLKGCLSIIPNVDNKSPMPCGEWKNDYFLCCLALFILKRFWRNQLSIFLKGCPMLVAILSRSSLEGYGFRSNCSFKTDCSSIENGTTLRIPNCSNNSLIEKRKGKRYGGMEEYARFFFHRRKFISMNNVNQMPLSD